MRGREAVITGIVFAIAVFLALDGAQFFFRVDLTEDHIFTLSPASRDLYRSLAEPATITYYVSSRLRKISPVPQEVQDLLSEYAVFSHGRVTVRTIDPERTGVARNLQEIGIVPEQMEIIDRNARTTADIYSGIEIQYLGRDQVIPFVGGTDQLEYQVTAAMLRLIQDRSWKVGLLVGDAGLSIKVDYNLLAAALGRAFEVVAIAPGAAVPRGLDALVVLGGSSLTEGDLLPIDRYVMEGGGVLFAVSGVSIDTHGDLSATPLIGRPIFDLIASYGIRISNTLVLDPSNRDFRTLRMQGGRYEWEDLGPYPQWIKVTREEVSRVNPILKNFEGLDLLWASPLVRLDLSGVHYDRLATSSRDAWIMKGSFLTNPYESRRFDTSGNQPVGRYDLAFALSGRFPSYFAQGSSRPQVSPPTRIVVVGDTEFLSDLIHYSDSPYNLTFAENAVDWLAHEDALLAIGTKGQWDPTLDRIRAPAVKRAIFRFAEVVNIFFVPLAVAIFGLRGFLVRRRRERRAASGR